MTFTNILWGNIYIKAFLSAFSISRRRNIRTQVLTDTLKHPHTHTYSDKLDYNSLPYEFLKCQVKFAQLTVTYWPGQLSRVQAARLSPVWEVNFIYNALSYCSRTERCPIANGSDSVALFKVLKLLLSAAYTYCVYGALAVPWVGSFLLIGDRVIWQITLAKWWVGAWRGKSAIIAMTPVKLSAK